MVLKLTYNKATQIQENNETLLCIYEMGKD